jgi:hypothetical protein
LPPSYEFVILNLPFATTFQKLKTFGKFDNQQVAKGRFISTNPLDGGMVFILPPSKDGGNGNKILRHHQNPRTHLSKI